MNTYVVAIAGISAVVVIGLVVVLAVRSGRRGASDVATVYRNDAVATDPEQPRPVASTLFGPGEPTVAEDTSGRRDPLDESVWTIPDQKG